MYLTSRPSFTVILLVILLAIGFAIRFTIDFAVMTQLEALYPGM